MQNQIKIKKKAAINGDAKSDDEDFENVLERKSLLTSTAKHEPQIFEKRVHQESVIKKDAEDYSSSISESDDSCQGSKSHRCGTAKNNIMTDTFQKAFVCYFGPFPCISA